MNWKKEGVNYWENPDCPKGYLEGALVRLIHEVEGVKLPIDFFSESSRNHIVEQIEFYEYVSDK